MESPTNSGGLDPIARSNGEGSNVEVRWDPQGHYLLDPGPPQVYSDPCAELTHELVHALDQVHGRDTGGALCGDTGLETREVKGTLAEDIYRAYMQKKFEQTYGYESPELRPRDKYLVYNNGVAEYRKLPKRFDECNASKGTKPHSGAAHASGEPDCTTNICASSNGDPHVTTLDGLHYDFQAAGEFVASKSTTDNFAIQIRQEPWLGDDTVSFDTAVAFNIDGNRFSVYVSSAGIETDVNGSRVALREGTTRLPSGSSITRTETVTGTSYSIGWRDSSEAWVSPLGSWRLKVDATPAQSRRGHLEGYSEILTAIARMTWSLEADVQSSAHPRSMICIGCSAIAGALGNRSRYSIMR
jgi:hypothetical protein